MLQSMSESALEVFLWGCVILFLFLLWAIPTFVFWLIDQFHRCPKCGKLRGRKVSERITTSPTRATDGKRRKDCVCSNCGHHFVVYEVVPRMSGHSRRSSRGSSSANGAGSSTYGGGSSAGGGAGRGF